MRLSFALVLLLPSISFAQTKQLIEAIERKRANAATAKWVFAQEAPDGGFYIVVVDATPAGAAGSRLTLYRGNLGKAKEIAAAIRSWATGASSTCPDLNG